MTIFYLLMTVLPKFAFSKQPNFDLEILMTLDYLRSNTIGSDGSILALAVGSIETYC